MCIQNSYVTNIKLFLAEYVFRLNNVVRTFQVCYPSALNRIPMNVMYAMLTTFTCNVGIVSNKKRKIAGPGRGKDGLGNKKEKIIVVKVIKVSMKESLNNQSLFNLVGLEAHTVCQQDTSIVNS